MMDEESRELERLGGASTVVFVSFLSLLSRGRLLPAPKSQHCALLKITMSYGWSLRAIVAVAPQ